MTPLLPRSISVPKNLYSCGMRILESYRLCRKSYLDGCVGRAHGEPGRGRAHDRLPPRESILPVDAPVYVLGAVQEDGEIGAPPGDEEGRFLIIYRSEEQLEKKFRRDAL